MYYDPSISVEELHYRHHPVLEIKRDGDDFFVGDGLKRRFRFGLLKAKMILTCMALIEEFLESRGGRPASNLVHCMNNGPYGILCSCTKYSSFKRKSRREIMKPYLVIASGVTKIGIGLEKAQAVSQKRRHLRRFVEEKTRNGLTSH
jgi:hypothetical protein